MAQSRKNTWLIVILLAAASLANVGIAKYRNPEGQAPPKLEALPEAIGPWRSARNLDMPQYVLAILRPDAWVSREYHDPSGRVAYVFAQFHATNRWGAHQPEVCFTSQGWAIEYQKLASTVERRLPGTRVGVNRFLAHKGESTQVVLYWWFSSGKLQTASRTAQMLDALRTQVFTGKGGGNGFIEVSMSLTPGSEAKDEEALERFAAQLVPRFKAVVDAPRAAN
ncbi:MAG: EpsI family protein [Deltaproteobacteria bacterium RBG_13_65_10]|nr:MAG: EpsI family protein [Deltaproteobacteria bacterium RBG_13_65_10]